MKNHLKGALSLVIVAIFAANSIPVVLACGPSVVEPVFKYTYAPQNPYTDFAAGKLGIIKPTFRRAVLFGAYRYLTGGGFSADEQKDLIDVWNAQFNNKSFDDNDVSEAVQSWLKARKEILPKEEKLPQIYTERAYGGYDFFPNCTKNAFETAEKTLNDRAASYGSDDIWVKDWLVAQDQVFSNCAEGRQLPSPPNSSMPEWLQKDRQYQLAAADFYSMQYADAKNRFESIGLDNDSPWQEIAQYLVGRTLIRQASAAKDENLKNVYYAEAEQHLRAAASGGKFAESAEQLIGLVKFRLRPEERVNELARELSVQRSGDHMRQQLIDYTWLLDKFEKEALESEEKRRKALETIGQNTQNSEPESTPEDKDSDGKLTIYFGNDDYSQNYSIKVAPLATDEEAIAEAEKVAGSLTEKMRQMVIDNRREAYSGSFARTLGSDYPGGYWGEIERSLDLLPPFLRESALTDWIFTYQTATPGAYQYSLDKFRRERSDLWLMTAVSKAQPASPELEYLIENAIRANPSSPAFPTITYHLARILIAQKKNNDAKKVLDELLNSPVDLTISARNEILELRVKLADSLDDFLEFSQQKPFAFSHDGEGVTLTQLIEQEKSYYDPEYDKVTKAEFDRQVDLKYQDMLMWEDRPMFTRNTVDSINAYFSIPLLLEAKRSSELPDYLENQIALAIWTRAIILDDFVTAAKVEEDVIRAFPQFTDGINAIRSARTPAQKKDNALYFLLKNPILSPFIESGFGKTDNEMNYWDMDDWWCTPFIPEEPNGKYELERPNFINDRQVSLVKLELQKIQDLGDGPNFLGRQVLAWQKRSPADKRIPESLYIAYEANGWTKYGCGNDAEIRNTARDLLIKRYPRSEWTAKVIADMQESN